VTGQEPGPQTLGVRGTSHSHIFFPALLLYAYSLQIREDLVQMPSSEPGLNEKSLLVPDYASKGFPKLHLGLML